MGVFHSREAEEVAELLSREAKRIALTPAFMRLESLKQLGCARWVFPGANHCRDEHSVAVACKARHVGQHLGASDEELMLLEVAGLCHDLGHGPFSHVWEHAILPRLGVTGWHHEAMSAKLLRHINTRHSIGLTGEQLGRITDIINGKNTSGLDWRGREWLLQVVASMVDVDRLDYLARDARNARFHCPHDFSQLLHDCQVLPDESGQLRVCFHESQQALLEAMFVTRFQLHTSVYQHHAVKGVEMMIADALAAADGVMGFSQLAHEPEDFIALTDAIIDQIRCRLRFVTKGHHQQQQHQQLDDLAEAAALLERIDTRQFYPCAAELTPYDERFRSRVSAAALAELCGGLVAPGDIRLVPVSLDHGRQDRDPLEAVTLHDGRGHTFKGRFRQPPPGGFRTNKLRVYLTRGFGADTDAQAQAIQALQAAVQKLVQQICAGTGSSGVSITHPCSQPDAAADAAAEPDGGSSNGQGSPEPHSAGTQGPLLLTPAAVAHRSLTALQLSQDSTMLGEGVGDQQTQVQLQELPFQGCYQLRPPSRKRLRGSNFRQQEPLLSAAQQALLLGDEEEGDEEHLQLVLSQADSLGS